MNKVINFEDWWINGGQDKASKIYSEQAEQNIAPQLALMPSFVAEDNTYKSNRLESESNRLFWDEVERLAKENKMHINLEY